MIGAILADRNGGIPMSCVNDPSPQLACVPGAIPMTKRLQHFALAGRLLNQHATERADLLDGYAFRFEADKLVELTQFIYNERKCCPFMRFELAVAPEASPIWLRMTGPDGTRAVSDEGHASGSAERRLGCGSIAHDRGHGRSVRCTEE